MSLTIAWIINLLPEEFTAGSASSWNSRMVGRLKPGITAEQARPLVRTLLFAVIVVLLIACANLAGLLLVRAIRRRTNRELTCRSWSWGNMGIIAFAHTRVNQATQQKQTHGRDPLNA